MRSGFTDSVWPPDVATPAQAARIAEVLSELGVAQLAAVLGARARTGEARKVLLARALAGRPRGCSSWTSPATDSTRLRRSFLGLVSGVARAGTPVVLATHRMDELLPEITRVAVLHGGRILAQGDAGRGAAAARGTPDRDPGPDPLTPTLSPGGGEGGGLDHPTTTAEADRRAIRPP